MMFQKKVMVFGVGNILKGDDGIGPAVVNYLEAEGGLPEDVGLLDIGTSIRQVLFDLLMIDQRPKRMLVVDAVTEEGHEPGEFWEVDVDTVGKKMIKEFSMHLFPTTNMLKDIKENTGVDVRVLVIQGKYIPDEIHQGLSPELEAALPGIAARVREICLEP